ncbi:MAG: PEGA domain-containing protein [Myxococcales bacterium]|nr:PEGA domain-containing protein [Myxococcales bacterium]
MRSCPSLTARLMTLALSVALVGAVVSPTFAVPTRAQALKLKRAGESDDGAAARLNEEGKKLVRKGKYYAALDRFHAALALFPISNAIFNVGSMLYTLKQYQEAFPYLEQTLRAPLAPEQRQVVLRYRADTLKFLKMTHAAIMVRTNPPGAKVLVNGKALPFPAPTRVLVRFGRSDVTAKYPGFSATTVVVKSSSAKPPKDIVVRMKREEPYAKVTVRCPKGADIFIDGRMSGFSEARTKLLMGNHVIRCGKTNHSQAFERKVDVLRRSDPSFSNTFDFSALKQ